MEVISSNLLIMFLVSVFAGSFGAITGGASLITIPVLMLLGLSPHMAIGTDRLGIIGVGVAGFYQFAKKGLINYKIAVWTAVPILFGSVLGAHLVLDVNVDFLKKLIVVINIVLLALMLVDKRIGVHKTQKTISNRRFAIGALLSFFVGFYGGFYGALGGSLSMYVLILVFGLDFLQGAAAQKVGSIANSVTASIVFALNESIDYNLGLSMLCGCLVGSYMGAHYAGRIGTVWIKRIFVVVTLAAVLKMTSAT